FQAIQIVRLEQRKLGDVAGATQGYSKAGRFGKRLSLQPFRQLYRPFHTQGTILVRLDAHGADRGAVELGLCQQDGRSGLRIIGFRHGQQACQFRDMTAIGLMADAYSLVEGLLRMYDPDGEGQVFSGLLLSYDNGLAAGGDTGIAMHDDTSFQYESDSKPRVGY